MLCERDDERNQVVHYLERPYLKIKGHNNAT